MIMKAKSIIIRRPKSMVIKRAKKHGIQKVKKHGHQKAKKDGLNTLIRPKRILIKGIIKNSNVFIPFTFCEKQKLENTC